MVTDPLVSGLSITSSPASGDAYAAGETITVDVTFDQTVTVTGAPNLALTIGSTARQATGSHVSGQSKITFSYTVATSDRDTDGISIAAGALTPERCHHPQRQGRGRAAGPRLPRRRRPPPATRCRRRPASWR